MIDLFNLVPGWVWVAILVVIVTLVLGAVILLIRTPTEKGTSKDMWRLNSRQWASGRDLRGWLLKPGTEAPSGSLYLGRWMKYEVRSPQHASLMILAPGGSGKTARLLTQNILTHEGPAVVASAKSDILSLTITDRRDRGSVWVFDPTGITGLVSCRWSPVMDVSRYEDCWNVASSMCASSKALGGGDLQGQGFWDSQGRLMVSPMVWAAYSIGEGMDTVTSWVADPKADKKISDLLARTGTKQAMGHWFSFTSLPDVTRRSVKGTAATVFEVWGMPSVQETTDTRLNSSPRPVLNIDEFLASPRGTLYMVAPASEQDRYTPLFETLTNEILRRVEILSARNRGLPIDPSLLLAIDEAANIAPLKDLDTVVTKCRGEGVAVVTVWQDDGQIDKIYGRNAARVIRSGHRLEAYFCGSIKDTETLDRISRVIGTDIYESRSTTTGPSGASTTIAEHTEQVAPPEWLQRRPDSEVIVTGSKIPPMRLQAPGWWEDKKMRERIDPSVVDAFDQQYGTRRRHK